MVYNKTYITIHEHLVNYLDNSLTNCAHPLPISEKIDTCHFGIKNSVRFYWEAGAYCVVTSNGNNVSMCAFLPDDITIDRIISRYIPDIDSDNC